MLVLTRRIGESVLVDGGIRITVLQTEQGSVKIGIEAPPEVGIFREEVLQRVAEENARASVSPEVLEELMTRVPRIGTPDPPPGSGRGEPEP